jgi:hypothetical protein
LVLAKAPIVGAVLVAVLMAVRFQLSCILVRENASRVPDATHSYQEAYATFCG